MRAGVIDVPTVDAARRGFFSGLFYGLALVVATVCAVTPFLLVPLEGIQPYPLLLIPAAAGVMLYLAQRSAYGRRTMLQFAGAAAGLSVVATLIMVALPPLQAPVPNLMVRLFHLDGIVAYRMSVYELWCEGWALLALFGGGLWLLISRRARSPQ
jgi:hypothetical protein